MRKQRQPTTGWFLRTALVAALACSAPTWAQHQGDQGSAAQSLPPKSSVTPPPSELEPPGSSQRSAQQVGSKVPVESIEPGVNTSATQPSSANAPAAEPAVPQSTPKPVKGAGAARSEAPAKAQGAQPAAAATGAPKPTGAAGKAHDTIQLDETQITGNRELPKVLYIVPWKRSDLGDLVGKPVNSLVDEVLAPVDRDVFKRQNRYFDALKPDGAKEPAGTAAKP